MGGPGETVVWTSSATRTEDFTARVQQTKDKNIQIGTHQAPVVQQAEDTANTVGTEVLHPTNPPPAKEPETPLSSRSGDSTPLSQASKANKVSSGFFSKLSLPKMPSFAGARNFISSLGPKNANNKAMSAVISDLRKNNAAGESIEVTAEQQKTIDDYFKSKNKKNLNSDIKLAVDLAKNKDDHPILLAILQKTSEQSRVIPAVLKKIDKKQGLELAKSAFDAEVKPGGDEGTLFRANTLGSKILTEYQTQIMNKNCKKDIDRIITDLSSIPIRVDPYKVHEFEPNEIDVTYQDGNEVKTPKPEVMAAERKQLTERTGKMLDELVSLSTSEKFPPEIRELSIHMQQKLAENGFRESTVADFPSRTFFLRFFNPAIISDPDEKTRKTRVFLSKAVQNLANGTPFNEDHMQEMNVLFGVKKPSPLTGKNVDKNNHLQKKIETFSANITKKST